MGRIVFQSSARLCQCLSLSILVSRASSSVQYWQQTQIHSNSWQHFALFLRRYLLHLLPPFKLFCLCFWRNLQDLLRFNFVSCFAIVVSFLQFCFSNFFSWLSNLEFLVLQVIGLSSSAFFRNSILFSYFILFMEYYDSWSWSQLYLR